MSEKIKLFVCDDHALFREAVKAIFRGESGVEIVGEAGNGREAIQGIRAAHPDVVLMDVSMPEMNGFEATRRIVQSSKETKVLILTMYDEEDVISRCLEAGASGYILKDSPLPQLLDAVQETFKGGRYFSPGILNKNAVKEYRQKSIRAKDTDDGLIGREREILKLLAEGLTAKEVGFRLRLPAKTVELHKRHLMHKINVHDRTELIKYAIQQKIVNVSSESLASKTPHKRKAA